MMEISIMDIILTILNFLILMGLLYLVLYKPVLRLLQEREEKIKKENEELSALRQEAEALKNEWEEKNKALAADVQRILEIARQDGLKEKEEIVRQAKEEAGQILIRAGQEARRERSKAWEDLWDEIVGIIITIATKAVGEEFNDEKHRAKIRSFIKQLDSKMIGELTNESH